MDTENFQPTLNTKMPKIIFKKRNRQLYQCRSLAKKNFYKKAPNVDLKILSVRKSMENPNEKGNKTDKPV